MELALAGLGLALVLISAAARSDVLPGERSNAPHHVMTALPMAEPVATLSPGNRLIARALHAAQKSPTPDRVQPWTLDAVVSARADGANWGDIFRRLKAERLIEAETLGQVVTWYQYHHVIPESGHSSVMPTFVAAPAGRNQTAP